MLLQGTCHCGAVRFSVEAYAPVPYQLCYCSICRKTAGGGGYAINLGADEESLKVEDPDKTIRVFRAEIVGEDGQCQVSTGERNYCSRCAAALWLFSPEWPELIHP